MNQLLASSDPLFAHGVNGVVLLIVLVKVLVGFSAGVPSDSCRPSPTG